MPQQREGLLGLLLPGEYPGTTLMQLFVVGFYLLQIVQGQNWYDMDPYLLLRDGANLAELSLSGAEPWRLITYAFLHGGIMHIGFNLYVLWILGKFVEARFDTSRFLIIYVASALLGGVLSAGFGGGLSVGASGATMGAMGAGIIATHLDNTPRSLAIRNQLLMWAGINVVLGIMSTGSGGPRVDNMAHLGGFLAGGGLGWLFAQRGRARGRARAIEGAIAAVLAIGSVGAMVAHQVYVRDVPVIADWSPQAQDQVAHQVWEGCAEAIDADDYEAALRPCGAYRYTVLFDTYSVLLQQSLYEALDRPAAAERQRRLLLAVTGEDEMPMADRTPEERIDALRFTLERR